MSNALEQELSDLLNRHSVEHHSNTPDFILARYLLACLGVWNTAVQRREAWYGRAFHQGSISNGDVRAAVPSPAPGEPTP